MIKIAGLDVGFSETRKSSGIGIFTKNKMALSRSYGGEVACNSIIEKNPFDLIAIDGPLVPRGKNETTERKVERLFLRGLFQKRCKPGLSNSGEGLKLRMAACGAADLLEKSAPLKGPPKFPLVRDGAIVEAFPSLFLGVCLGDDIYARMPPLRRGKKFDWLYDRWVHAGILLRNTSLPVRRIFYLQKQLEREKDHEHRAAIICVLTGMLVAHNDYVAVGEDEGGWFFLPPFTMWAPWAINELNRLNKEAACVICTCQSKKPSWSRRFSRWFSYLLLEMLEMLKT